jgi:plasmid maintenance system killer protein
MMHRFADQRAETVFVTGFAHGVPAHISRMACWDMRVLVAARTMQDVGVIGRIIRWRDDPGRHGLMIGGKWCLTFAWEPGVGAIEIAIERR